MKLLIKKIGVMLALWMLAIPYAFAQEQDRLGSVLQDYGQLGAGQTNAILQSMGVSGPSGLSVAKIMAWMIFGSVGFVAFFYGKKQKSVKPFVTGLCLMGYPYFVSDTFWLYAVGIGFCVVLYFWRD